MSWGCGQVIVKEDVLQKSRSQAMYIIIDNNLELCSKKQLTNLEWVSWVAFCRHNGGREESLLLCHHTVGSSIAWLDLSHFFHHHRSKYLPSCLHKAPQWTRVNHSELHWLGNEGSCFSGAIKSLIQNYISPFQRSTSGEDNLHMSAVFPLAADLPLKCKCRPGHFSLSPASPWIWKKYWWRQWTQNGICRED